MKEVRYLIIFNETKLIPVLKQLTDYVDIKKAQTLESDYIKKYKNDKWKILNIVKSGSLGSWFNIYLD